MLRSTLTNNPTVDDTYSTNVFAGNLTQTHHQHQPSQQLTNNTTELLLAGTTGVPLLGTSYDSSLHTRHHQLLKHELYQAKRQLADAQNSFQFLKREKLRVEHEKNVLEIQLRQVEEGEGRRRLGERERDEEVKEVHRQWELEKDQVYLLQR